MNNKSIFSYDNTVLSQAQMLFFHFVNFRKDVSIFNPKKKRRENKWACPGTGAWRKAKPVLNWAWRWC